MPSDSHSLRGRAGGCLAGASREGPQGRTELMQLDTNRPHLQGKQPGATSRGRWPSLRPSQQATRVHPHPPCKLGATPPCEHCSSSAVTGPQPPRGASPKPRSCAGSQVAPRPRRGQQPGPAAPGLCLCAPSGSHVGGSCPISRVRPPPGGSSCQAGLGRKLGSVSGRGLGFPPPHPDKPPPV